jgi:adenylate cyclase
MTRLSKAVIVGIFTGIIGVMISALPSGLSLEENTGLEMLFHMRGERPAPADVIIVSVSKESADKLNLPSKPEKWPRALHAQVVDNLVKEGAKVIAFDILFSEPRSPEDDTLFAQTIKNAGNVVLVALIEKDKLGLPYEKRASSRGMHVEKLVLPIPVLSDASLALAPLPIPKVPVKVSQYWTFKTSAGDTPTLPVIVFQLFTADAYAEFIRLLQDFKPAQASGLPPDKDTLIETKSVAKVMKIIRDLFVTDVTLADKMLQTINSAGSTLYSENDRRLLELLIMMYQSHASQYINFYGPPHSIKTIPYHDLVRNEYHASFKGKAVFIGESETFQPEQKDGYYTVFSQPNGLDLSGVEIAATAFANLLENMSLQPLPFRLQYLLILVWGLGLGFYCRFFGNIAAMAGAAGISFLYLWTAYFQFTENGRWLPIVVPLFFQVPLALGGSVIWKYYETYKERQNIGSAIGYYLPAEVIDRISHVAADIEEDKRVMYGICLSTDAEHYTSVSEDMDPFQLGKLMNKYYDAVFKPVKYHDGIISNVVADSMLALWVNLNPDSAAAQKAGLAALDIAKEVEKFNQVNEVSLRTRIGLHAGYIFLGNIGAADHYEYRPIGDIVNTSSRIEGLNKYLGTHILISDDIMKNLYGFLSREVGIFKLVGKSNPLVIHELVCRIENATQRQKDLCTCFSDALAAYKRQSLEASYDKLNEIMRTFGEDGPSRYYLNLCLKHQEKPFSESWDGVVFLDKK